MAKKIRQEINLLNAQMNYNGSSYYWCSLLSTDYDGTVSFYFEVVAVISTSSSTVKLINSYGDTEAEVTVNSGSVTRYRSSSFSPNDYYPLKSIEFSATTITVYSARIVIIQSDFTKTQTQIEIGTEVLNPTNTTYAAISYPKNYLHDTGAFDGTYTIKFGVNTYNSATKYTLYARLWDESNSSAVSGSEIACNQSGRTYEESGSITLTTGHSYIVQIYVSSTKNASALYTAKIIITQTASITKVRSYYLIRNNWSNTPGLQDRDTLYDPAEWDDGSGSTTFYHRITKPSATNNTAKLQSDPNGTPADITNSTTPADYAKICTSSAMTMPSSSKTVDVYIIETALIHCSMIVVDWVYASGTNYTRAIAGALAFNNNLISRVYNAKRKIEGAFCEIEPWLWKRLQVRKGLGQYGLNPALQSCCRYGISSSIQRWKLRSGMGISCPRT